MKKEKKYQNKLTVIQFLLALSLNHSYKDIDFVEYGIAIQKSILSLRRKS